MADAVKDFSDKLADLLKIINKTKKAVLREFSYLSHLNDLIIESEKKLAKIKDQRILKASEKSIRKHAQKIMKKTSKIEYLVDKDKKKIIEEINELLSSLPPSFQQDFENKKFQKEILIYADNLLKFLSKKRGSLSLLANKLGQYDPSGANLPLKLKELSEKINQVIKEGTEPLLAVLENIQNYFEKNKSKIKQEIDDLTIWSLDMDSFLTVRGLLIKQATILIDANFAKAIATNKLLKQQVITLKYPRWTVRYRLNLTAKEVILPERVFSEITKQGGKENTGLSPRQLTSYLIEILGAKRKRVNPNKDEEKDIIAFWRRTKKARNWTKSKEDKFRDSGDMSILTYVKRNPNQYFIILSNDSEIIEIIKFFKNKSITKSNVFRYENERLDFAA